MDMILFDNSSLNMLYHISNNSALPIVLAGSDTRVMEWIVWDDLCKKKMQPKMWNTAKKPMLWKQNKNLDEKTKQMFQPEKADN